MPARKYLLRSRGFNRHASNECDVRAGDGILWQRPLIPHAKVSADTVAVGRQLGALPTVVLPLTEVHVRTG